MPRTGPNIYKRKDGRWEGRFKYKSADGRTIYKSVYARSYKDVKQRLDEAKIKTKQSTSASGASKKEISFEEISSSWLLDISKTLKTSSTVRYENLLNSYILPMFKDSNVSGITSEDILELITILSESGEKSKTGLSSNTLLAVTTVLSMIRDYAIKRGYSCGFSTDLVSIKSQRSDIRVFTELEEKKLIEYLKKEKSLSSIGVLICLFTGLRVGEICALKWDNIDLKEKTLKVDSTMQRIRCKDNDTSKTKVIITEPKSKCSKRLIPIPGFLVGLLKDYYVEGAFVLTGLPDRFVEPRTMQNRFKKMLARCEIPDANFHATRHTFATRCVELDFDIKSLSEILGHSSVVITMNRYVHPTMPHKAANMEKLSKLIKV